jgi:ABC-type glycerol-3-phosphate transport system substrate-binding protein
MDPSERPPAARGVSRRTLVRAAGLGAAGGALALGLRAPRAAALAPNTTRQRIVFRPGYNASTPVVQELFQKALDPFRAKNPSLDVQLVFYNPGVAGWTAEILAGTAPDVFEFYLFNDLASGGYLLNLSPYVKSSNVDLSVFPTAQIQFFTVNGNLYGLPVTNEWTATVINLTLLDKLGLPYPSPDWTVQEAADLYRKLAKPNPDPTKAVYGGHFWMYYSNTPSAMYLAPWGASVVDPTNRALSGLDTPEMLAATTYMNDLIQEGVVQWDNTLGWGQFLAGTNATALVADFFLVQVAQAVQTAGFEFDFWPMPRGPKGGATYGSEAYYAIPVTTKHPDAAWALLDYVVTTPNISRLMLDLWLYPPPSLNLGEEYLARIRQLAPPLRNKNLNAFVYWTNHAVQPPFKYEDAQAEAIVSQYFGDIWTHKMSPQEALSLGAKQVATLEKTGASLQAAQAAALAKVEALNQSTKPVTLPPPPVAGTGVPATVEPSFLVSSQGTYTLLGVGVDVSGTGDACTYACAPTTSSAGTWVCRVVSLANVSCPQLSAWAKVGLMARSDLSNDAAMVFLAVTGGNGISLQERPTVGYVTGGETGDGGRTGLMAASYVTRPPAQPAANYLLQPIWLKLVRQGTIWTAYTSLDGVHWTQAGRPVAVAATSMWIGLFATPQNGAFGGKGYIRATFDHVSFVPTAVYQIGQAGTPPAAGPVPANWATATAPATAAASA